MSGEPFSEFRSALCCTHEWVSAQKDGYDWLCPKCGAQCSREAGGRIERYRYPASSYEE